MHITSNKRAAAGSGQDTTVKVGPERVGAETPDHIAFRRRRDHEKTIS